MDQIPESAEQFRQKHGITQEDEDELDQQNIAHDQIKSVAAFLGTPLNLKQKRILEYRGLKEEEVCIDIAESHIGID
jgi:hypothetical protein